MQELNLKMKEILHREKGKKARKYEIFIKKSDYFVKIAHKITIVTKLW